MPTARPSIIASVEVVAESPKVLPSAVMPEMPMETPMVAVRSGMPAAIIDPKVSSRTMAETRMPMPSPEPPISALILTASPPASTVSPPVRAFSVISSKASWASSLTSGPGTL